MEDYINYLNNNFDRIYLITLRRAVDRKAHYEQELKGLHYTVFYGQDKEEFDVEELIKQNIYNKELAMKNHRYGKTMPAGMIGCSWSHQLVYKDIIKNNYKKALILEDDVVIDQETIPLLRQAFTELPADWELVYLGFAANESGPSNAFFKKAFYHLLRSFKAIKYSHKTINNLYPKKITEHVYKSGYHDCTHAYAITFSAAEKLLKHQTPISFFPDNLLAYAATNEIIKAYIILPKLINQQYQVSGQSVHSYINQ